MEGVLGSAGLACSGPVSSFSCLTLEKLQNRPRKQTPCSPDKTQAPSADWFLLTWEPWRWGYGRHGSHKPAAPAEATVSCLQDVRLSHCVHLALLSPLSPFRGREAGGEQRGFLGGRHCRDKGLGPGVQAKSGKEICWLCAGGGERDEMPAPEHIGTVRM